MFWFAKFLLALFIVYILVLNVSEARRSRSKANRKCPSSCLRKIRDIERKLKDGSIQGPPGPRGPQGLKGQGGQRGRTGRPGPQGPPIRLPICKNGEYLTSDGVNLRCEKLNIEGVCSTLRTRCSINNDEVAPNPEKPPAKVPDKMVKFMKNNMIQSIGTDAWDIGVFQFENSWYFGLSQIGKARFQIFKWYSGSFKDYQNFKINNARNWSPFRMGNDQYLAVANYGQEPCSIYRYDRTAKFVNESFSLECHETMDLKPFVLNGVQFIAVANHKKPHPTVIWRWNGRKFVKMQEIPFTGTYLEVFELNGKTVLAVSGSVHQGPHVYIYEWDGKKFQLLQRLFTQNRPYDIAAFEAGDGEFLAVATLPMIASSHHERKNVILVLKWNGKQFETFQNITGHWARRITAVSSPLMAMGKKTTYLAIVNFFKDPEIYYWVAGSSTKFEKLQDIGANFAIDMSFFEMGTDLYLLMASRKNIDIFRGELV